MKLWIWIVILVVIGAIAFYVGHKMASKAATTPATGAAKPVVSTTVTGTAATIPPSSQS